MTKSFWALRGLGLVALFLGGCAAETSAEDREDPGAEVGTTASALAAFDPCSPTWQLPTSARHALHSTDPAFLAFEDRLGLGGRAVDR